MPEGKGSAVFRSKNRDSDRGSGVAMGTAASSGGDWAHVEYALPGRQRRDACGLGPEEIMSYPGGAVLGRDRVERMAVV